MSVFFFSSRRRHTRWPRDWSSDVCSSDLGDRASRAPGPYGRGHVMRGALSPAAQLARQAQIEFGCVNADKHIGLPVQNAFFQLAPQSKQARQMANDFRQPHDAELVQIMPGLNAGRLHGGAGYSGELNVWAGFFEAARQAGPQRIA